MSSSSSTKTKSIQPRRASYQFIAGRDFRSINNSRADSPTPSRSQLFRKALTLIGRGDLVALRALSNENNHFDLNSCNRRGWRLIHLAAEAGHIHVVLYLLQQAVDAEAKDSRGWTALMLAASRDRVTIVHALLLHGVDRSLALAIRVAAANGAVNCLHALLARTSASEKKRQCKSKHCPVRLSTSRRHLPCLQALLIAGFSSHCIARQQQQDPTLAALIKHSQISRKVIEKGINGIVVSALTADDTAMRVRVEFAWPEVIVRRRRGRTILFRKRAEPVLNTFGYDEDIRMVSHDAIMINQLTIKLDIDEVIRGDHVAAALHQRQTQISESFAIANHARALSRQLKARMPALADIRATSQEEIVATLKSVADADMMTTEELLRRLQPMIKIRLELRDELERYLAQAEVARVQADDMAVVLELIRRIAEAPCESFPTEVIGKRTRVQRELHVVYQAREELEQSSSMLTSLIGKHTNVELPSMSSFGPITSIAPVQPSPSSGQCFQCSTRPATVPLASCRHLGLCSPCGIRRQSRIRTKCVICHHQVDNIMSDVLEQTRSA